MNLKYDSRGNLSPYGRNKISWNLFKEMFVTPYNQDSTRHKICSNIENYLKALKTSLTSDFRVWINGSFVTNKLNPNDIDIVILLDANFADQYKNILETNFLNKESINKYGIDAYIIKLAPEGHSDYGKTRSDLLYWEHWFTKSKTNRAKKRFPKGYIELSIDLKRKE